ncbi:hypothetical protein PROFUN_06915 [Planoprotostelium fungivorum]|uniref:Uncharacterized protein n=1 Tax=Planoprotostelium fungivorum TaxID=1890364 RepID=A0A2P6NMW7_9EUKA|nr:hypothetical protein PROFUN_06915 [Planoprotostelium fungivorum]
MKATFVTVSRTFAGAKAFFNRTTQSSSIMFRALFFLAILFFSAVFAGEAPKAAVVNEVTPLPIRPEFGGHGSCFNPLCPVTPQCTCNGSPGRCSSIPFRCNLMA